MKKNILKVMASSLIVFTGAESRLMAVTPPSAFDVTTIAYSAFGPDMQIDKNPDGSIRYLTDHGDATCTTYLVCIGGLNWAEYYNQLYTYGFTPGDYGFWVAGKVAPGYEYQANIWDPQQGWLICNGVQYRLTLLEDPGFPNGYYGFSKFPKKIIPTIEINPGGKNPDSPAMIVNCSSSKYYFRREERTDILNSNSNESLGIT